MAQRFCRGVRGATTVATNDAHAILGATRELLEQLVSENAIEIDDIASIIFSTTPDLDAEFPAKAARELGWLDVPLLCTHEMRVPGALERCIRVLVHWNTDRRPSEIRHLYLRGARRLRPDLARAGEDEGPTAPAPPVPGPIAVIGLGLIGGSLVQALRTSGWPGPFIGYDANPGHAALALKNGVIDRVAPDPRSAAAAAETVVLAAPVDSILVMLDEIEPVLRPGTLVLDVGSTKRRVAERMDRLPAGVLAVAGHPMCGKEVSGIEHAEATLFRGAVFALCETDRTDETARERAERIVTAIGARPLWISPEAHDRAVAAVSHLPHLLAVTLVLTALDDEDGPAARLAASGFRDTSRLAASDVRMCLDILRTNREDVLRAVDGAGRILAELRDRLAKGDFEALGSILSSAADRRRAWARVRS